MVPTNGTDASHPVWRPTHGRQYVGLVGRRAPRTGREQGPIRWIFRSSVGLGVPLLKQAAVPSPHGAGRWDRCLTHPVWGPTPGRKYVGLVGRRTPRTGREQGLIQWIFRSSVGLGGPLVKRAAVPSPHGSGRWDRCLSSGLEPDSRSQTRRIDHALHGFKQPCAGASAVGIPLPCRP